MEKKQTEMGWVGKVILGYSGGFRGSRGCGFRENGGYSGGNGMVLFLLKKKNFKPRNQGAGRPPSPPPKSATASSPYFLVKNNFQK